MIRRLIDSIALRLYPVYEGNEAREIAWWLVEELSGRSRSQLLVGDCPPIEETELTAIITRLHRHEPIQYIFGHCYWMGLDLKVTPATLIPRPETAELVTLILNHYADRPVRRVLDIGTGSGCIALALAQRCPHWQVHGMDNSSEALAIARSNAQNHQLNVHFFPGDILATDSCTLSSYDLVVSNPPYICQSEAQDMRSNVLDWEPHAALFVPDQDPLLFYRAIARRHIAPYLAMEINELMGDALLDMLSSLNYHAQVLPDSFGHPRFLLAQSI